MIKLYTDLLLNFWIIIENNILIILIILIHVGYKIHKKLLLLSNIKRQKTKIIHQTKGNRVTIFIIDLAFQIFNKMMYIKDETKQLIHTKSG